MRHATINPQRNDTNVISRRRGKNPDSRSRKNRPPLVPSDHNACAGSAQSNIFGMVFFPVGLLEHLKQREDHQKYNHRKRGSGNNGRFLQCL